MNHVHLLALTAIAAGGGHGDAHGAHGDHSIDWFMLGSMIVNALIFFGFLFYALSPTVRDALRRRRASFAVRLEEAQRKQAEAEARLAEYAAKLEDLEAEVRRVVESYESQARHEAERMRSDNERAIERLARETDQTIEQEFKKAERNLRDRAVLSVLESSERLVEERITEADRRRLVDQYIAGLRALPEA